MLTAPWMWMQEVLVQSAPSHFRISMWNLRTCELRPSPGETSLTLYRPSGGGVTTQHEILGNSAISDHPRREQSDAVSSTPRASPTRCGVGTSDSVMLSSTGTLQPVSSLENLGRRPADKVSSHSMLKAATLSKDKGTLRVKAVENNLRKHKP